MPFLDHDGIQLYFEQHGSGPPLLLLAGLASDSRSWPAVLPGLAERFTLILLDNRGVGRSSQDCAISISLMADDCAALIRYLRLTRVSLLGHSMGGMVALECARRHPELVERLLLAATAARNPVRNNLLFQDWADLYDAGCDRAVWFRSLLYWIFTERFFEDQRLLQLTLEYLLNYPWPQSAAAFRQQIRAIAAFDARGWLGQLNVPTCVLAGELDRLMPLEQSNDLVRQLPDAVLTVLQGAPHSLQTEQPELFVRAVVDFLKPA
ncbi:alpha/beta fold hydrolase [Trichlorobacter lovleyi]|uniref:Alpha/beta hydrolase fold n=1 Tax=Trichlorobacter lovleyi (strain ATCC BAA-1151 / DSM 17278 / SZ) TaxID=398767 RepID=B3E5B1_TRIL1|nr:alpha/beta hydrolase [Trichlorobacter lovleyi]ACD96098.1 alpha/beta hydrolase fold [Trichlorobacter lovleyi SZ]